MGSIALTLVDAASYLAGHAPIFGLIALLILAVGVTGYLFTWLKDVAAASARAEAQLPGWPEITSPADFVVPFGQYLALMLFSFGPLLVWLIWNPDFGGVWVPILLGLAGTFYLPMAFLGIAQADSIAGINPLVLVPSIVRIFGHYFVAWMLVTFLFCVQLGGKYLADLIAIPLITTFAVEFFTLYLLVVTARVLGMIYFIHRDDLDWFR
jgi:hypothetical protein